MATIGTLSLYRQDRLPVPVRIVRTKEDNGMAIVKKVFEVQGSRQESLGRVTLCPKREILYFFNHTEDDGPEKICGIGKVLMECVVAECFPERDLRVEAAGSHWIYMHFGFVPILDGKKQLFPRYGGDAELLSEMVETRVVPSSLQDFVQKKLEEAAIEQNVSIDQLSWQEVFFADIAEMPKIFARAMSHGVMPSSFSRVKIKMHFPMESFAKWIPRILSSSLKHSPALLHGLHLLQMPKNVQKIVLEYTT